VKERERERERERNTQTLHAHFMIQTLIDLSGFLSAKQKVSWINE
jgi:hypothetical protein